MLPAICQPHSGSTSEGGFPYTSFSGEKEVFRQFYVGYIESVHSFIWIVLTYFIGMKYGTRYKRKCSDMIIKVKQSEDIKQESYNSKCAVKSINFGREAVLEMMPQIIELIEQKTADMNK